MNLVFVRSWSANIRRTDKAELDKIRVFEKKKKKRSQVVATEGTRAGMSGLVGGAGARWESSDTQHGKTALKSG